MGSLAIAYAGPSAIEFVPAFWVWCAWIAYTAVFFAMGAATVAANGGPLAPDPNADSRFKTEREGESKFRETYRARFGAAELIYVALAHGAGGLLLWFADGAKLWAAAMLGVLGLWLIVSHITTPFTLHRMSPRLVGTLDWIYYETGAVAWAYILACVAQRWHLKF